MSDTAYVARLPLCDLCKFGDATTTTLAAYDARTLRGQWANVCEPHFTTSTDGTLGTGHGQRLIVGDPPERTRADVRADIMAALAAGDFDAAEDAIGDGDICEFL